jgi:curved DNA-binding protein CbpA
MGNKYLETLHLQSGATKQEIKAAYRKLSKKYHPDLNTSAEAAEQFIRIKEAYTFLMEVGPFPGQEKVSYGYDPLKAEFEERRRRAYEYARQKAREEQERQDKILATILRYFNGAALLIGAFNLLLAVDYFLPRKEFKEKILAVWEVSSGGSGRYTGPSSRYNDIRLENFAMRVGAGQIWSVEDSGRAVVAATPITKVPLSVSLTNAGKRITLEQRYSVYRVFGFIIPGAFTALLFYFFLLSNPDQRLGTAVLLTFLFLTQLFLYFRF